MVGKPMYEVLHAVKRGIKDAVSPQPMFEDLGLKYVGPVDGHDLQAMESALRKAKGFNAPVIVHAVTRKGYGYRPAEDDEADCLHGPGARSAWRPASCWPRRRSSGRTSSPTNWSQIADERPDVVGITAAMAEPTGIAALARKYPERVYDVGIAEQHAATSAAGLAMGGLHPVVAVYATFLNRAFDQVLLDVAMHELPVTFVLDRAGVDRPGRAEPLRHLGHERLRRGARPADRRAARRGDAARGAARGGRGRGRPDDRALPDRCRWRPTCPPCAGSARSTCCARTSARTCCWSRWARSASWAWRSPSGSPGRGTA